jgi:hypothetical protein
MQHVSRARASGPRFFATTAQQILTPEAVAEATSLPPAVPREPLVIRGLCSHFAAVSDPSRRWTSGLRFLDPHREHLVSVEMGNSYLSSSGAQAERAHMPLGMLQQYFSQYAEARANGLPQLYLAQYPLFEQLPSLTRDLGLPKGAEQWVPKALAHRPPIASFLVNAWIGMKTVSPPHTDPNDNIFCQIVGRKRVRLWRPEDGHGLYLSPQGSKQQNTSLIPDILAPDVAEKFPLFAKLRSWEAELGPGDGLVIPRRWFHWVHALDDDAPTVSVNYWLVVPKSAPESATCPRAPRITPSAPAEVVR